jgi:hypothetical protein
MKKDPYKHKQLYLNWRETISKGIEGISKANSDLIINYVTDMEKGINISNLNRKGARSYPTLNKIKQKIIYLAKEFEKNDVLSLADLTEEQVFDFFSKMRSGEIRTKKGEIYKSVGDYVKVFKSFWHWFQKEMQEIYGRQNLLLNY